MQSYFDKCKVEFLNIRGGDIPDDEYFKIKAISNSKLKLINPYEEGSPQLYKEGFPFTYNPSLILGTSIHELFLQSSDFQLSSYEGKPSAKLGLFIDTVYKYRQRGLPIYKAIIIASEESDYYVGKLTPKVFKKAFEKGFDYYKRLVRKEFTGDKEVIVLSKQQRDDCVACLNSLNKNREISKLFKENIFEPKEIINEFALLCDIKVTLPEGREIILPFKGKLDSIIIDPETRTVYLNDLKTTSKAIEYFMGAYYEGEFYEGSLHKLHYYRQAGIYMLLLQMYCDYYKYLKSYDYKCNIILVETNGEHRSQLCRISNSYIKEGLKEFKELICLVAFHEIYGYDTEFTELTD